MRHLTLSIFFVAFASLACGPGSDPAADGGPLDGGAADAGRPDAGPAGGPLATVSEASVDFGEVVVGETARRTLRLENRGDADLVIEAATVGGTWCEVEAPEGPVAAGGSAEIVLRATPTREGAQSTTFDLVTNGGTLTVPLRVQGRVRLDLQVEPRLVFPPACPGTTLTRPVAFTNEGDHAVTLRHLGLQAPDGFELDPAFALAAEGPLEVAAGATVEVDVAFTPPDAGVHLVELAWTSSDLGHMSGVVSVFGRGDGPRLGLSGASVDFGAIAADTALTRTITATSACEGDLEIRDVRLEDGGAFEVSGAAQETLSAGETRTWTVRFAPAAAGDFTGRLLVTTNDPLAATREVAFSGRAVDVPGCALEGPVPADLALTVPNADPERLLVTLQNTGTGDCLVGDVRFGPGTPEGLAVEGDPRAVRRVAPGEILRLWVTAPALLPAFSGSLDLYVSDPASGGRRSVPIEGTAAGDGRFAFSPALGPATVGCATRTRTVCLDWSGDPTATITSLSVRSETRGGHFEVVGAPAAGSEKAAGFCAEVRWRAEAVGPARGTLEAVLSTGERIPLPVSAEGVGATVVETFRQLPGGSADVLFVLSETERSWVDLLNRLPKLMDALRYVGVDYHLGVTTADVATSAAPRGRLLPRDGSRPRFVDASSPDPVEAFGTLLRWVPSNELVGDVRPLEAAYLALSPPRTAGWNLGFRRPGARLSVVFFGNRTDDSSRDLAFYEAFLSAQGAVVSLVGQQLGPQPRLEALAAGSGGGVHVLQELSSWDDVTYESIAESAAGYADRFFLSGIPDRPAVLAVTSEGASLTGWTWDADLGAVVFDPASLPATGDTVTVSYDPVCF